MDSAFDRRTLLRQHPRLAERDDLLADALGPLLTLAETERVVWSLLQVQADAVQDASSDSSSRKGDAEAKDAFYTLLLRPQQLRLFERFCEHEAWLPKAVHLFGAPPYSFLPVLAGSNADVGLQASGLARSRVRLAYDDTVAMPSHQFGSPHLRDAQGREYRVFTSLDARWDADEGSEAGPALLASSSRLVLVVRVASSRAWQGDGLLQLGDRITLDQPIGSARRWRYATRLHAMARVDSLDGSARHARTRLVSVSVLSVEERHMGWDEEGNEREGGKRRKDAKDRGGKRRAT